MIVISNLERRNFPRAGRACSASKPQTAFGTFTGIWAWELFGEDNGRQTTRTQQRLNICLNMDLEIICEEPFPPVKGALSETSSFYRAFLVLLEVYIQNAGQRCK